MQWLALLPHSKAKASFLWSLHVLLSLGGNLTCCHVLFPSCVVKHGSCSAFTVCCWLPGIKRSRRWRKTSLSRVGCTHLSCSTADQIVCMFYSPAVWHFIQHNFKLHAVWKSIFFNPANTLSETTRWHAWAERYSHLACLWNHLLPYRSIHIIQRESRGAIHKIFVSRTEY